MQKLKIKLMNIVYNIERVTSKSWYAKLVFCVALSWIYAISSQCCFSLPFHPVPFTMQVATLLFCAWLFGQVAVFAYVLYLLQGLAGAPFFSHFGSGLAHLLGPTGGYLIGFLFSMMFIAATRNIANSNILLLCKYWLGMLIFYTFALARLSFFVPAGQVLVLGFYPFFIYDFGIKAFLMLFLSSRFKR